MYYYILLIFLITNKQIAALFTWSIESNLPA